MKTSVRSLLLLFLFSPVASVLLCQAALERPPSEDIDFIAEHLAEAAMNNRWLSLPKAPSHLSKSQWTFTVEPGFNRLQVNAIRLDGPLLAASVGRVIQKRWTVRLMGFYDQLYFSGGQGRELFNPVFHKSIPLDIPENAVFSNPRGEFLHWGIGPAVDWELSPSKSRQGHWFLTLGILWDRVHLKNYAFDYSLKGGTDAGRSGVLDHSARYNYVVPLMAVQYEREVGSQFSVAPRFIAGIPLPRRSWVGRITGDGFDLRGDTKSAGNGTHVGDGFSGFGLTLSHRPTGLAIDVGTTIYQLFMEKRVHKGIDQDIVVSLSWSFQTQASGATP